MDAYLISDFKHILDKVRNQEGSDYKSPLHDNVDFLMIPRKRATVCLKHMRNDLCEILFYIPPTEQ